MANDIAIVTEMAELKASMARLSERLEGKRVTVDPYLPFTPKCQRVVDRFRETGVASAAIGEAWPYGKSHFYRYKERCPRLKQQWNDAKEAVHSSRLGPSVENGGTE